MWHNAFIKRYEKIEKLKFMKILIINHPMLPEVRLQEVKLEKKSYDGLFPPFPDMINVFTFCVLVSVNPNLFQTLGRPSTFFQKFDVSEHL